MSQLNSHDENPKQGLKATKSCTTTCAEPQCISPTQSAFTQIDICTTLPTPPLSTCSSHPPKAFASYIPNNSSTASAAKYPAPYPSPQSL